MKRESAPQGGASTADRTKTAEPDDTDSLAVEARGTGPALTEAPDETSMLDWALRYASHEDRPVFPCIEKAGIWAKAPYKECGLIEHGHLEASTDSKQITLWWLRWPHALIGSPVPADLICLDLDPRKGGTIEALTAAFGKIPETEFVMSGRSDRGAHLFYRRPAGFITASVLKKVCPGVDIKLDTGYTILPPSLHPDTKRPYQWGGPPGYAPLPERIRDVLQPRWSPRPPGDHLPSSAKLAGIVRTVRAATEGDRNGILYWAAMRLVEGCYPESAYDLIADAALATGLPQSEVNKAINSARKALAA
jgi:hypothetical protein